MSKLHQMSHGLKSTVACAGLFASVWTSAAYAQNESSTASVKDIVVSGQRQHYRGDVALKELPQAVQVITGETLKEVGITRLPDALDLAAGVARQNTFGGVWDSFAIRGFAGDLNVPSGYLVNGFNGGRGFGGLRDTSSVERIEVLKGPGSALFGRGEPGGTVSITTKKPQFDTQGSVTLAGGSYNFYRAEGDFTTPLSDSVAIRINGAVEDADSFRDTLHSTRYFASPSILAKLGEDTIVSYELEWSRQKVPFDRGVVARDGVLGIIPNSRFLGEPGDPNNLAKVLGHQLELQHNFTSDWALLVGGAYRETKLSGFGQHPELVATRQPFLPPANQDVLSRQRRFASYDSSDLVLRAELSGSTEIEGLTHHILLGADYEEFKLIRFQTRFRPPVFTPTSTLTDLNAVNIFDPVYGNLADATVSNIFNDTERQKATGIYFTDQIDLSEQFKVRVGARYDWFKQSIDNRLTVLQPPKQDVTAFSPQLGLVYEPSQVLTFYAAYAKGFRPNSGFDIARNPFEPEKTTSYEVGMKFTSPDQKLNGTIALFTMEKTNVIAGDPNPNNSGFSVAFGKAKSKGIEFDLSGELPWQVRFQLSYAYTDAESGSALPDPDFRKDVEIGDPLINIPKHNASALVFKDFDIGERKFTIGAGVKYISKRLGETGTDFYLPGYTLVRVNASYELTENLTIAGEVTNLFDEQYWPASYAALWVAPGAPRQFQVRASYKF